MEAEGCNTGDRLTFSTRPNFGLGYPVLKGGGAFD